MLMFRSRSSSHTTHLSPVKMLMTPPGRSEVSKTCSTRLNVAQRPQKSALKCAGNLIQFQSGQRPLRGGNDNNCVTTHNSGRPQGNEGQ